MSDETDLLVNRVRALEAEVARWHARQLANDRGSWDRAKGILEGDCPFPAPAGGKDAPDERVWWLAGWQQTDDMIARQALTHEVARLKSLALTCCSCNAVLATLGELKAHIVRCPEHPIAIYVRAERRACEQAVRDSGIKRVKGQPDAFFTIECAIIAIQERDSK